MSTFGTVISAADVETWLKDFVRKWMMEYMSEYERQKGFAARHFAMPWAYETSSEFTYWSEDHLPHIVFVSPGMNDRPTKRGTGAWEATWLIAATAVVGGSDRANTRQNQMAYATCIRWMVSQYRNLERPEVRGATLMDESYRDIPSEDARTIGSASVVFEVEVEGIMSEVGLPPEPNTPRADPYITPTPEYPTTKIRVQQPDPITLVPTTEV